MHADFLAAICAEPDEPVHRLVYADWLEEHGTTQAHLARAELIRVQLAREAADPDGDDYWALRTRERVLLAAWGERLVGKAGIAFHRVRFRGGFPAAVKIAEPLWLHPLLDRFPIGTVDFGSYRVWSSVVPRLTGLDAVGPGWGGALLEDHRRGALHNLRHLGVRGPDEPGVEQLLATEPPPNLRSLAFRSSFRFSPESWQRLLDSPWLPQLDTLVVEEFVSPTDQALASLSGTPAAAGLRTLAIGEGTGFRLSAGPYLAGLESLTLRIKRDNDPAAARGLWDVPLPNLRHLRVTGMLVVAGGPLALPRLVTLEIDRLDKAADALALLDAAGLPRLRRLRMGQTEPHLATILAALDAAPAAALRELLVGESPSYEIDLAPLARSRTLAGLNRLEIQAANAEGFLARAAATRGLASLSWTGVRPSEAAKAALQKRFDDGEMVGGLEPAGEPDFPGEEGWL